MPTHPPSYCMVYLDTLQVGGRMGCLLCCAHMLCHPSSLYLCQNHLRGVVCVLVGCWCEGGGLHARHHCYHTHHTHSSYTLIIHIHHTNFEHIIGSNENIVRLEITMPVCLVGGTDCHGGCDNDNNDDDDDDAC